MRIPLLKRTLIATTFAVALGVTMVVTTHAQPACNRGANGTGWCSGDLLIGSGAVIDQLIHQNAQPAGCQLGNGADSNPIKDDNGNIIKDANNRSIWDCAVRQNAGTYFLYDQNGAQVTNGAGAVKVTDALASGTSIIDAQSHQAANTTSWDIVTNTMTTHENSWWTTGCAQSPTIAGPLLTTGFWSNVVSAVPNGGTAATQGLSLGNLTRVSNGVGGVYGGFQPGGAESVVFDRAGNYYIGTVDGTNNIFKFDPNGTLLDTWTVPTINNGTVEQSRGTDWLELAADGQTMYYTSESDTITVFRLDRQPISNSKVALDPLNPSGPSTTLDTLVAPITDFAGDPSNSLFGKIQLQANNGVNPPSTTYALRLLPPGDGSGGFIVAGGYDVFRLGLDGKLIRSYLQPSQQGKTWFAMDITPDGQFFWTASLPLASEFGWTMWDPTVNPSTVLNFHIGTGQQVGSFTPQGGSVTGLCIVKEYTSGTGPDCSDPANSANSLCHPIPASCDVNSTDPACKINFAPVVGPVPDQHWAEGQAITTITIPVTDPTNTTLTMSKSFLPAGVTITQSGNTFTMSGTLGFNTDTTGTPTTLTVTNGRGVSASTTFTWFITGTDAPPTLVANGVTPSSVTTGVRVQHGVPLTTASPLSLGSNIVVQSQDQDSCDGPTGSLQNGPSGLTFSTRVNATACLSSSDIWLTTISGAPYVPVASLPPVTGYGTNGVTLSSTFVLTDGGGKTVTMPISWVLLNTAPVLTVPATQTLHGSVTALHATATDANNDPVKFTATGLPAGVTIDATTGNFNGSPTAAGVFTINVTADDGVGGVTTKSFTLTIANTPPQITVPPNQTRHVGTVISPAVVATAKDNDGDPFTFTVDPTTLPPGVTASAPTTVSGVTTIQFSGTPTAVGNYTTKLTATDSFNQTTTATFTWAITNAVPTLTNPGSQFSVPNAPFALQLQASDADLDPLAWSITGLPAGLTFNTSTGLISGTAPNVTTATTYTIVVTVTDRFSAPVSVTFTLTVSTNRNPVCGTATASPNLLWPPNHKFATIKINGVTDPDPGDTVTITVTSIYQDEPTLVAGSGNTAIDGIISGATAQVRAERSGLYNGRLYFIGFSASDGKGGSCTGTVTMGVPHDQGQHDLPIDSGMRYNSTVPGVPRLR
ncbi:MAG TPA: putative Ig domain-containing protein [Vicinamibacterales bacterium]|nr:putative Ig domain-containing protein [Vicinamibacterales bacterium]